MDLVIIDIISNNYTELDKNISLFKDKTVLALTPSGLYYLENKGIKHISFHCLISEEKFKDNILKMYSTLLLQNIENNYFKGFFREVAQHVNYLLFVECILTYIEKESFNNVIYLTDRQTNSMKNTNISPLLPDYIKFNNILTITPNSHRITIGFIDRIKKYTPTQLFTKLLNKISSSPLSYDWLYINPKAKPINIALDRKTIVFNISSCFFQHIKETEFVINISEDSLFVNSYLTFLEGKKYIGVVQYRLLNNKTIFFQHGSYLYQNIFIKYSEIEQADVNLVINDYTKKLFKDLGAKKVYSVGSMLFNKPIKKKKKEYDFVYITQGHDYIGNLQYIDFPNSLHSFDGNELYQRHKKIIKLFGEKFKDKKIIIRVHPVVVTSGVYVPFWELAEPYPNVSIDVSIPIHSLIEKSKYIISDYFTTEFINRELHYKRDIILFRGAPTPLPEETIEDMKKMFILVDTIDDLEDKISNIEEITKNRQRYDDIIEYYSSKKCDTKRIVTEILKKELNART